ncbi:hypothetical protein C8J56DRAFT_1054254 [Mycena floridula]|nr:hypothetical protein C8J56DRAFT_1054254 [Mycena floridula]
MSESPEALQRRHDTIEKCFCLTAEKFAGKRPSLNSNMRKYGISRPAAGSKLVEDEEHEYHAVMWMGRGQDFQNAGCYLYSCWRRGNGHKCDGFGGWITDVLTSAQLQELENLWVEFEATRRPWGAATIPESTRLRVLSRPPGQIQLDHVVVPQAPLKKSVQAKVPLRSNIPGLYVNPHPAKPPRSVSERRSKRNSAPWSDVQPSQASPIASSLRQIKQELDALIESKPIKREASIKQEIKQEIIQEPSFKQELCGLNDCDIDLSIDIRELGGVDFNMLTDVNGVLDLSEL